MAASSNSSLSGSSVSSGKFLQRAPHFSPPSILAGSYLCAERLAVPLAPTARQALPEPRAGAPRGRDAPARGPLSLRRYRKGKPGRGKRGGARFASPPPCRAFVWGEGEGSPAPGSLAGGAASLPFPGAPAAGLGVRRALRGQRASSAVVPAVRDRLARRVAVLRGERRWPGVPLGGCCGTPRVVSTSTGLGTIKFPIRVKHAAGDGSPRV